TPSRSHCRRREGSAQCDRGATPGGACDRDVIAGARRAMSAGVRILATAAAGILGVALATWGVVQLMPRDVHAAADEAELAPARTDVIRSIRFRGDADATAAHNQLRTQVGGAIDAPTLAADRARLEASLIGDGHLDARVT